MIPFSCKVSLVCTCCRYKTFCCRKQVCFSRVSIKRVPQDGYVCQCNTRLRLLASRHGMVSCHFIFTRHVWFDCVVFAYIAHAVWNARD